MVQLFHFPQELPEDLCVWTHFQSLSNFCQTLVSGREMDCILPSLQWREWGGGRREREEGGKREGSREKVVERGRRRGGGRETGKESADDNEKMGELNFRGWNTDLHKCSYPTKVLNLIPVSILLKRHVPQHSCDKTWTILKTLATKDIIRLSSYLPRFPTWPHRSVQLQLPAACKEQPEDATTLSIIHTCSIPSTSLYIHIEIFSSWQ